MGCILIEIFLVAKLLKREKNKDYGFPLFALLSAIFKCHHGGERVNFLLVSVHDLVMNMYRED